MPTVKQLIVLGSKSPVNSDEYNLGIELGAKYLNREIGLNSSYPPKPEPENPLDDFIDEFGGNSDRAIFRELYFILKHNLDYLYNTTRHTTNWQKWRNWYHIFTVPY